MGLCLIQKMKNSPFFSRFVSDSEDEEFILCLSAGLCLIQKMKNSLFLSRFVSDSEGEEFSVSQ